MKLVNELQQRVPNTFVGYYEGQQHVKMALESDEDLQGMYPSGNITLWYDGATQEAPGKKGKRGKSYLHPMFVKGKVKSTRNW